MSDNGPFNAAERARIADVLKRWAQNHPDPREPIFYVPGSDMTFCAESMAQAAARPDSEEAQVIYGWFALIVKAQDGMSLEDILQSYERLAALSDDEDDVKNHRPRPPAPQP